MRTKYLIPLAGGILLFCGNLFAGEIERAESYYTPGVVSLATATWTAVPPITAISGRRIGLYVNLPATNVSNAIGVIGSCAGVTYSTITVRPIELIKGSESAFFPLGAGACLYFITLNSATEKIYYQEVR